MEKTRNRKMNSAGETRQQCTVMRIFKLKIFTVPVRLRSGSGNLFFVIILPCVAIYKNVVHSLEPGTRRLTRLQTMHNVLKYSKTF